MRLNGGGGLRARCVGEGMPVSQDRLGLYDARPNAGEIRTGLSIIGLLFIALLVILPLRDIRTFESHAFVPAMDAVMFISELINGTLIFAQAAVYRSRALTILAAGYVAVALLFIPHALTFPGAFSETGLLGAGLNTTGWIASCWRVGFPLTVVVYALLRRREAAAPREAERPPARVRAGLAAAITFSLTATAIATLGHDLLPSLYASRSDLVGSNMAIMNVTAMSISTLAVVLLLRRDRSVLDLWLLVAMAGWLFQSVLNMQLSARFTVGWYGLWGMILVSTFVVTLALVAESSQLYVRLALSSAERNRERETRLMSMDAVAAAIAHEVGQPLAAVTLNASAGVDWLRRDPPDPARALGSMQAAVDAGARALEVIKSVRATYNKNSAARSEFGFNDLVRETATLLDRDVSAHGISLELDLAEPAPPVHANRVQLQRVILNLLANAIDSVCASQRRPRRISMRTLLLENQDLRLDVSDSGDGVTPGQLSAIFEPFFTTKSHGTGLGLSLSRSIIEHHGGRLWASGGPGEGATFHLQLPGAGAAAAERSAG